MSWIYFSGLVIFIRWEYHISLCRISQIEIQIASYHRVYRCEYKIEWFAGKLLTNWTNDIFYHSVISDLKWDLRLISHLTLTKRDTISTKLLCTLYDKAVFGIHMYLHYKLRSHLGRAGGNQLSTITNTRIIYKDFRRGMRCGLYGHCHKIISVKKYRSHERQFVLYFRYFYC